MSNPVFTWDKSIIEQIYQFNHDINVGVDKNKVGVDDQ